MQALASEDSEGRCRNRIPTIARLWAHESGIIDNNPSAGLKLPKVVGDKAPVFLTLDETCLLLKTAKLPRNLALFWYLSYGLRIAEVAALQIGDVAPPNGSGLGSLAVPVGCCTYGFVFFWNYIEDIVIYMVGTGIGIYLHFRLIRRKK